jgi:hypothetical protein
MFGPLTKAWQDVVLEEFNKGIVVDKYNFLRCYWKAREKAFTEENIRSSFERCGIWPVNRSMIKETALAPSIPFSTCPAQALPALLPALLEPIPLPANAAYRLVDQPSPPTAKASKEEIEIYASRLSDLLRTSVNQMGGDYAQMVLMEKENGELRQKLFNKKGKGKTTHYACTARVLTSDESMDALSRLEWKRKMLLVLQEWGPLMKIKTRALTTAEREAVKRFEDKEKVEIKDAETTYKCVKKALQTAEDKYKKAIAKCDAALEKVEMAKLTTLQRTRAEAAFYTIDDEAMTQSDLIESLTPRRADAERILEGLIAKQSARLEVLASAEAAHALALAEEEKENKEEERLTNARAEKRSALPQLPKNPIELWKAHFAVQPALETSSKENQKGNRMARHPLLPAGWRFDVVHEIMELDADEDLAQAANIVPTVQWEGTEGEVL